MRTVLDLSIIITIRYAIALRLSTRGLVGWLFTRDDLLLGLLLVLDVLLDVLLDVELELLLHREHLRPPQDARDLERLPLREPARERGGTESARAPESRRERRACTCDGSTHFLPTGSTVTR